MTVTIVGAGMAGLLAANMLQRHKPVVLERGSELPNNHHAVLRFRSSVVADVLGIPFKRVSIIKDALPWKNPVADALAYSLKNTGTRRSDRSITAGLTVAERFIAPSDLISRMAADFDIQFGYQWLPDRSEGLPTISTIPMPQLMSLLGWSSDRVVLQSQPAVHVTAKVRDCDAYVSLLVPDPANEISRVSLTGNELSIELPGDREWSRFSQEALNERVTKIAHRGADLLGIWPDHISGAVHHNALYAKIIPIDDDERKEFIYEASAKHNIFSLGRYATWRPGLLLDDLVQDVRKIEGWLGGRSHYAMVKERR